MSDALARAKISAAMQAKDERDFQNWYSAIAKRLRIAPNPDDPEHHYDYRAFFRDMKAGKAASPDEPGGHFPSTYKVEGHPRTYLQDSAGKLFDTRSAEYAAGGTVPQEELAASEQAPDMPGMTAEKVELLKNLVKVPRR